MSTSPIGPEDWAVIPKFHLGETYFAYAVAPAFLARHGGECLKIVTPPYLADIGRLFGHHPAKHVDICAVPPESIRGAAGFQRGEPFYWHPLDKAPELIRSYSGQTVAFSRMYLEMVGLPVEGVFAPPRVPAEVRTAANARFLQLGLKPGRTVILAPVSRTLTPPPTACWLSLAARLRAGGWTVCQNLSVGEQAAGSGLPGYVPLVCPLSELLPLAEMAGWVITARNGVCELLSTAAARLTVVATYRALNPVGAGTGSFTAGPLHRMMNAERKPTRVLWDLASCGLPDPAEYFYLGKDEPANTFVDRVLAGSWL